MLQEWFNLVSDQCLDRRSAEEADKEIEDVVALRNDGSSHEADLDRLLHDGQGAVRVSAVRGIASTFYVHVRVGRYIEQVCSDEPSLIILSQSRRIMRIGASIRKSLAEHARDVIRSLPSWQMWKRRGSLDAVAQGWRSWNNGSRTRIWQEPF